MVQKGTVDNILKSDRIGLLGRALNGLDFGKVDGQPPDLRLATDLYAHRQVRRRKPNLNLKYPLEFMRWALASTGNTTSTWHTDIEGMGTHIRMLVGTKIWFVVKWKDSHYEPTFLKDVKATESINEDWEIEYVVLPAGSQL